MSEERIICTKDNPYTDARDKLNQGKRWAHEEAEEVSGSQREGWPSGDTIQMRCCNCGIKWRVELPQ